MKGKIYSVTLFEWDYDYNAEFLAVITVDFHLAEYVYSKLIDTVELFHTLGISNSINPNITTIGLPPNYVNGSQNSSLSISLTCSEMDSNLLDRNNKWEVYDETISTPEDDIFDIDDEWIFFQERHSMDVIQCLDYEKHANYKETQGSLKLGRYLWENNIKN